MTTPDAPLIFGVTPPPILGLRDPYSYPEDWINLSKERMERVLAELMRDENTKLIVSLVHALVYDIHHLEGVIDDVRRAIT